MKGRFLFIVAIMAGFGLIAALRPAPHEIHRTEDWLESATPTKLDGYEAIPGPKGDLQTYRMSDATYKLLQAFGIVTRVFTDHSKMYDVCVIAGNSRNAFHDPTSCFPDQDWKILDRKEVLLQTKTRGAIPISLMHVQHLSDAPTYAIYTYKGPRGMEASQSALYMDWSVVNFLSGEPQEGAFYRFMALEGTTSAAELTQFAADYMDEIKVTSAGIL